MTPKTGDLLGYAPSRGRDRPVRRRRSNRPGNSQAKGPCDGQTSGKWCAGAPSTTCASAEGI